MEIGADSLLLLEMILRSEMTLDRVMVYIGMNLQWFFSFTPSSEKNLAIQPVWDDFANSCRQLGSGRGVPAA
jgi:hypothetical protein